MSRWRLLAERKPERKTAATLSSDVPSICFHELDMLLARIHGDDEADSLSACIELIDLAYGSEGGPHE